MDVRPLVDLVTQTLGKRGMALLAVMILLGGFCFVVQLAADAAVHVRDAVRERTCQPQPSSARETPRPATRAAHGPL